ncbi:amino acid ABC transporter permease [Alloiococcus sp. CFN-8]|uniref:amino acid ABC transporter permease n=1 Tax=Alloiococcus sp. CFN-8 TaxID=3416081 RepID=UPI003CF749F9
MNFYKVFTDIYPMLFEGLAVTLKVSLLSLFIALFLGFFSCIMGISTIKPLQWVSRLYIWIIRGTPFIVQLFIIKYGIPQLIKGMGYTDFNFTIFQAAVATLALNAGAYMSEIFRGGIQAIDPGQMEAARSLGLPKSRAMLKVILPQAFKISIPALGNQFIITLKDSSLAQVIGLQELVYQGKIYVGRTFKSFETYLLVGFVYLIIITVLSYIIKQTERKMNYGKKS